MKYTKYTRKDIKNGKSINIYSSFDDNYNIEIRYSYIYLDSHGGGQLCQSKE